MPATPTKAKWNKTPEAKAALASLRNRGIGVISHVTGSGTPRSAVVNLTVDGEFRFYLVTQKTTEKYRNMFERRDVALNIGFDEERVDNFQIVGKAQIVKDARLWKSLLKALLHTKVDDMMQLGMSQLTSHYPFRTFPVRDYVIFAIIPSWIRRFHHPSGETKPVYTQILGKAVDPYKNIPA